MEKDTVEIHSGIFEGRSLGTPIAMSIPNKDVRSTDYKPNQYRPSHADFTYDQKYGHRDWRGGGRASARETAARVAAGSIAKQVLNHFTDSSVLAWVEQIHHIKANIDPKTVTLQDIESNIVRCPDQNTAAKMIEHIEDTRINGDSLGGVIRCHCSGIPIGLGEPVFDKLEADLAKAMLSIPATKGFSIGAGFDSVYLTGSQHNDPFIQVDDLIQTKSNHSGGVQGGISNGMPIWFRVAFKPTSTIFHPQQTVKPTGEPTSLKLSGRHDPCVLPRAVPIVEAMTSLVLVDHWLRQQSNRI
jgi:chorismate synthase